MTTIVSNTTTVTVAPAIPAWASSISSGAVAAISLNVLTDVNPCSGSCVYNGLHGYAGMMDAWTTMCYAPDLGGSGFGSLLIWGGGNGDYWGTQITAFDLADNPTGTGSGRKWTRLDNPTVNFTSDQLLQSYSSDPQFLASGIYGEHCAVGQTTGTPGVPHDYDGLALVPAGTYGGSAGRIVVPCRYAVYRQGSYGTAHYYDLASRTWSRLTTGSVGAVQGGPASCYDPKRQRVWMGDSSVGQWVGYTNLASPSQVRIDTGFYTQRAMTWHYLADPRDRIIVFANDYSTDAWGIWIMDPNNPTTPWVRVTVTGDVPSTTNGSLGSTYCDDLDCFFLYDEAIGRMQQLWKLNIPASLTSGAWNSTLITMSGTTVTGGYAAPNGMYKRFCYVKKAKRILWCSTVNDPVFAYRPVGL